MANKIVIDFQVGKGSDKLVKAIDLLAKAQSRLNNTVKQSKPPQSELDKTLNKVSVSMAKTSQNAKKVENGMFGITNSGRLLTDQNKKVQHSFATIRSQLLLVSFGFSLVSGSVLKLVKLFGEQELAEKRLTVALGRRSEALINQASALQQQTRFGDEAIIGAQAMLAAFVKEEEGLKKATQATLDLAAAKGMDLNSAADLIAKSIGSSTNSLTRYGIEAEGAAGSTERLESIVGNIAKIFGGFAKGELNTTLGMLSATGNAVSDAGEKFGEVLQPAVMAVLGLIKDFSESISVERVKGYGLAISGLAIAYNRASIAVFLLNNQIMLSRTLLIKSGYGIALLALGELASRYIFTSEKIAETTEEVEKNNEAIKEITTTFGRESEEIEKSVESLEKKLAILELNASATSEVDQLNLMLIQNGGAATQQEYDLMQAIASVTVERKNQEDAIKAQARAMKTLEAHQRSLLSLETQILIAGEELNGADSSNIQLMNIRAGALKNLLDLEGMNVEILGDMVDVEGFLKNGLEDQNLAFENNTELAQSKIDLIVILLGLQEELIEQNQKLTDEEEKINNIMEVKNLAHQAAIDTMNLWANTVQNNLSVELQALKASDAYNKASKEKKLDMEEKINKKYRTQQQILFRLNQAQALADVFFSTQEAVGKARAAFPVTFGEPWASILMGLGVAQAAAIATQKMPAYEQGGYIGGQRHAQGGTIIEAERGEFVMSRNAVESIGVNNLEAMNAGGGGASIVINNPIISSEFVETELPELIAEAVRKGANFGMS